MAATIVNLLDGRPFDPGAVLSPAWRSMQVVKLGPNEGVSLEAADDEYACFVVGGTGRITVEGLETALVPGTAVVMVHGATARADAGADGLSIFVASLAVPGAGPGG